MSDAEQILLKLRDEVLRRFDFQCNLRPGFEVAEPFLSASIDAFSPISLDWKTLPIPIFIGSFIREYYECDAFGYIDDNFDSREQYEELFRKLIKSYKLKAFL